MPGYGPAQLPHAEREAPFRSFDKEMIVLIHEAIGMAEPGVALVDVARILRNASRSLSLLKTVFFSFPHEVIGYTRWNIRYARDGPWSEDSRKKAGTNY
jgi:hypothetical protein